MNLGNEVVGPCVDRRTGLDLLAGRAGLSVRPTAQRRSAAAIHHVLYLFAMIFLFRCRTRATSGVRPFLLSPGDSRRRGRDHRDADWYRHARCRNHVLLQRLIDPQSSSPPIREPSDILTEHSKISSTSRSSNIFASVAVQLRSIYANHLYRFAGN